MPYSQHYFQYGYANPVSNSDPTGMCAETGKGDDYCHEIPGINYWRYDRTISYMHSQMMTNALSDTVRDIQILLEGNTDPNLIPTNQADCVDLALVLFYQKVKTNAEWDHKPILKKMLAMTRGNSRYFPIRGDSNREYFFDLWSNIHYGFVGSAAGFSAGTLHLPGALAGQFKEGLPTVGRDNPGDRLSVQIGIDLWNAFKLGLTPANIQQEILKHTQEFVTYEKTIPLDDRQ
jgi:hypothetical protein